MHYGTCFLCGKVGWLEDHHIFPAALRDKSDRYGLVVGLCGESCHRTGKKSAHCCRETADSLKQYMQIKWMIQHQASVAEFRHEFYKNYIELEDIDDERKFPMNIVAESGRLTRDPELRYTVEGQKAVATFCIAVDRPGTRDKTDFLDCVAWEQKAEFLCRNFKKGQRIEVSGVLTTRNYEEGGKKRKATEIRCDNIFFGYSKPKDEPAVPAHPAQPASPLTEEADDGGELPF